MSTDGNEGPQRSDFQESRRLPDCGERCEHVHGDQADPPDPVVDQLRAEVLELGTVRAERDAIFREMNATDLAMAKHNAAYLQTEHYRLKIDLKKEREDVGGLLQAMGSQRDEAIARSKDLEATLEKANQAEHALSMALSEVRAERDGAINLASAARRDRDTQASHFARVVTQRNELVATLTAIAGHVGIQDPPDNWSALCEDPSVVLLPVVEEREACAKVAASIALKHQDQQNGNAFVAREIFDAIRARGGG